MNIRSLTGIPQPILSPEKVERQSPIKMQNTADRDADGRQTPGDDRRRPVTEDELQKILESLRNNPGVKTNNLVVNLVEENEVRVIYICDAQKNVIRRFPEESFYQLLDSKDQANGRIFHKAA